MQNGTHLKANGNSIESIHNIVKVTKYKDSYPLVTYTMSSKTAINLGYNILRVGIYTFIRMIVKKVFK